MNHTEQNIKPGDKCTFNEDGDEFPVKVISTKTEDGKFHLEAEVLEDSRGSLFGDKNKAGNLIEVWKLIDGPEHILMWYLSP